jgi:CheY-like chemotaxis protein
VIDDGPGIPAAVRSRLFEPFFTTKPAGKGTGLGLATSLDTVREHGGTLTYDAQRTDGAAFLVTLPLSSRREERAPLAGRQRQLPTGVRVLLVDDDEAVRAALHRVLASAGVTVFEADSGAAALAALAEHEGIDVVLLDRVMPEGPGEQFVPGIRRLLPSGRLVFLSGQAVEPQIARLADAVVSKPVRVNDLLHAVWEMVEARASVREPNEDGRADPLERPPRAECTGVHVLEKH